MFLTILSNFINTLCGENLLSFLFHYSENPVSVSFFLPEKVKHPQKLIVTSNCTLLDKTVSHALSWYKVNWKGGGCNVNWKGGGVSN